MIYILDDKIKPGRAVRGLVYSEDSDLDGDTLTTDTGEVVECAVGSVAMKPGGKDLKQLGPDGNWASF